MTPFIDVHQCYYLRLHSFPPIFASERAELAHIDQQLTLLDTHISQLGELREVLQYRSRQLHNLLSPIYTLPVEVLSHIFQRLSNPDHDDYDLNLPSYRRCLAQALVLISVSSHFRYVALGTFRLWQNIPLYTPNDRAVDKASSLVQHCVALAPSVNISVSDRLNEYETLSAIDILLSPDVTRKIKNFELFESLYPSFWIERLQGSSFPMLDNLSIACEEFNPIYDFSTLMTLTRLSITRHSLSNPIITPPSIRRLCVSYVQPLVFLSLVHQCLDLVDCEVKFDPEFSDGLGTAQATEPVTLNHLKRLAFCALRVGEMNLLMSFLLERIRLPSLETLQLEYYPIDTFMGVLPLCRDVSATLTTLVIKTRSDTLDYDDLYQVCRVSFPKLVELEFWSVRLGPFLDAAHALALVDDECSKSERHHLPALRSILLRCRDNMTPRSLLDLLKKRKVGNAFLFHIQLTFGGFTRCYWPSELGEELESIVGTRRIEVTWGDRAILSPGRRNRQ